MLIFRPLKNPLWFGFLICATCLHLNQHVNACRVGSEKLKDYTTQSIEGLLDADQLESFYWAEEPLDEAILSKVTGLNITLAETRFNLDEDSLPAGSTGDYKNEETGAVKQKLLRDIFVTCSADKDRSYTLTLNLELNNPFKAIYIHFKQNVFDSNKEASLFRIRLPQSTLLVQLNQRISYDECLDVNYIQLAPNLSYNIECLICNDMEREHLAKVFSKRMTQLDNVLDSMLGEKLRLGLQTLLSQQRLDLDLYLN